MATSAISSLLALAALVAVMPEDVVAFKDVVFVMDINSGPKSQDRTWTKTMNFIQAVVDRLSVSSAGDHVAVTWITGDKKSPVHEPIKLGDFVSDVSAMEQSGNTNVDPDLTMGIYQMHLKMMTPHKHVENKQVAVIISDSTNVKEEMSKNKQENAITEADNVKNAGIKILCVGVANSNGIPDMDADAGLPRLAGSVASKPGTKGTDWWQATFETFGDFVDSVANAIKDIKA